MPTADTPLPHPETAVVVGGLGFTGSFITRRLLSNHVRVTVLTGHPQRRPPDLDSVTVAPFNFEDPAALTASLQGAAALYNTYWIRFSRGPMTFDRAVRNTETLLHCARDAGIQRVIHLSVTNPSPDSPLPYFRGKARAEEAVMASGLSYAIIRPTLIFAAGDILFNNIAWALRRFPIYALFGDGSYQVQPVAAEDVADLAVRAAAQTENLTLDAAGPDTYTLAELVGLIRTAVHSRAVILRLPPPLALALATALGWLARDVLVTRDELASLMANLLVSHHPPLGTRRFTDWLQQNAEQLGRQYASELARHWR